jgi:hypothetical protein
MTAELGEINLHGEDLEWALGESGRASGAGINVYVRSSVRLQAVFLQETGASRRYSNGCPAI